MDKIHESKEWPCDMCESGGLPSIYTYQGMSLCTQCANSLRFDGEYATDEANKQIENIPPP